MPNLPGMVALKDRLFFVIACLFNRIQSHNKTTAAKGGGCWYPFKKLYDW